MYRHLLERLTIDRQKVYKPLITKVIMTEKQFYTKWWFWVIIAVVVLGIIGALLPSSDNSPTGSVIQEGVQDSIQNDLIQKEVQESVCISNWQCDSWSKCSDFGTQARICSDTNNCGTSEGKLPESQTCTPPSWHEVTFFSGTDDKTTDTFNIKGDKFKLTYYVIPANDYDIFYLYVYREGESLSVSSVDLQGVDVNSKPESTIVYEGTGSYYLDIGAANLQTRRVSIEDYY